MSQLWPSSGKSNERPIELKSITKCFFQVTRFVPHCSPLLSIFLNMAFPNFETEFSFSCLFFPFSFSAFIAYWQWLGFSRSRKLQQVQVHATDLGSTAVCMHTHAVSAFQTHDAKVTMEIGDLSVAAKFPLICNMPVNTIYSGRTTLQIPTITNMLHIKLEIYQNCSFGSPTLAFHFFSIIFPYFHFSNTVPNNVRDIGPKGDLFFTPSPF